MKWLRVPDPLTLLVACVVVAAGLSYVLPAGEYQRREDPQTGRQVVVVGTYARVDPNPVGLFDAMVAIPRGMANAADVVFMILFGTAAFTVVDRTGALATGVSWLVRRLGHRRLLVIPAISLFFAAGGVVENMQEEVIALIPVLTLLARRLGFTPLVAVAMSLGSAFVGASFSPINPFQVVIAQQVADVPRLSGWAFRTVFLVLAVTIWIVVTMRHASRTRDVHVANDVEEGSPVATEHVTRHLIILVTVAVTFVVLAWGLLSQGWDFNHLTALFFVMGVVVGLIGKLGLSGTARVYTEGFREMALAAVVVGVARAIFVVLEDGRIVDTIVHGLFTPIADLPRAFAALAMMVAHMGVHFPVPSVSGQAALTMPIMAPLADLLGMSRQIAVLAYQVRCGDGGHDHADQRCPDGGAGDSRCEIRRVAALYRALVRTAGGAWRCGRGRRAGNRAAVILRMTLKRYLATLPERLVRSVVGLGAGVAREVGDVALPQSVRHSRLYQNLVETTLRFLIEQVGEVEGVYSSGEKLADDFLARRTVGNAVEALGVIAFRASPVWVLAALADVCGLGRHLIPEIATSLKEQGLLDADTDFTSVDQMLDGLERTSARVAQTINTPPLDVPALREEWRAIKQEARSLAPERLPTGESLVGLWSELKAESARQQKSVYRDIVDARALRGA